MSIWEHLLNLEPLKLEELSGEHSEILGDSEFWRAKILKEFPDVDKEDLKVISNLKQEYLSLHENKIRDEIHELTDEKNQRLQFLKNTINQLNVQISSTRREFDNTSLIYEHKLKQFEQYKTEIKKLKDRSK